MERAVLIALIYGGASTLAGMWLWELIQSSAILSDGWCHHVHFVPDEAEAQVSHLACPGSCTCEGWRQHR